MATKKKARKKTKRAAVRRTDDGLHSVLDLIGPDYVEAGGRTIGDRQIADVLSQADAIRKRIRDGFALPRVKVRAELMISLLTDFWSGKYRHVSYRTVSLITFALHYVVAPVDIIPDSLPVIGEVDDAIVVALCARMVHTELEAYGVWQIMHAKKRK